MVVLLVGSYTSALHAWWDQRSEITAKQAEIVERREAIRELENTKRRYEDPAYIQQQARERFGWVMPGETGYQVIDRDGKPMERHDELTDPDSMAQQVPDPWWGKVYGTLEAADHPKKKATPKSSITPPPTEPTPSPGQ